MWEAHVTDMRWPVCGSPSCDKRYQKITDTNVPLQTKDHWRILSGVGFLMYAIYSPSDLRCDGQNQVQYEWNKYKRIIGGSQKPRIHQLDLEYMKILYSHSQKVPPISGGHSQKNESPFFLQVPPFSHVTVSQISTGKKGTFWQLYIDWIYIQLNVI